MVPENPDEKLLAITNDGKYIRGILQQRILRM